MFTRRRPQHTNTLVSPYTCRMRLRWAERGVWASLRILSMGLRPRKVAENGWMDGETNKNILLHFPTLIIVNNSREGRWIFSHSKAVDMRIFPQFSEV